jgi:amidase
MDAIPYTAEDSHSVKGLTVASGSPAFEHLLAGSDALQLPNFARPAPFSFGLTNMPSMATQEACRRTLRPRRESVQCELSSGSFMLRALQTAQELLLPQTSRPSSSVKRRGQLACINGLLAYTPSCGVISMHGNWPLIATMDVVVPHARSVSDLLEVLDALVSDDASNGQEVI